MASFIERRFDRAASLVGEFLHSEFPSVSVVEDSFFPKAWEIQLPVGGEQVAALVLLPLEFPSSLPKVRLKHAERFWLKIPHVEKNGTICLYTNAAAPRVNAPVEAIKDALARARTLLETPNNEDFYDEFYSYWQTVTGANGRVLLTCPDGSLPSEGYAFFGSKAPVVAADEQSLRTWCRKILNETISKKSIHQVRRIDLAKTLLPSDFPSRLTDLLKLLREHSETQLATVVHHLSKRSEPLLLLFRIPAPKAHIEAAIKIVGLNLAFRSDICRGFRPGQVPWEVVLTRAHPETWNTKVERLGIQSVAHQHVHTRSGNGEDFSFKRVVLFGCGSLGSYVAHLLTKAGIGHLTLVDDDSLAWDNVGRHLLGAPWVGVSKAQALAATLQLESPHLSIEHCHSTAQAFIRSRFSSLQKSDLVISCTGAWATDHFINLWGRQVIAPLGVLFGWIEPHGVAGHSLLVHPASGGCLNCGCNPWGEFELSVTEPEATQFQKGDGCSGFYQAYGVVEMTSTATEIVRIALDYLAGRCSTSELRSWIGPRSLFELHELKPTVRWSSALEASNLGFVHSQPWSVNVGCSYCGGSA